MAATLKDVAKLAEVDIGSVSRTLGNHPRAQKLRPETRQRILDAARKASDTAAISLPPPCAQESTPRLRSSTAATTVSGTARAPRGCCTEFWMPRGQAITRSRLIPTTTMPSCIEEILSSQIKHVISMSTKNGKREETAFLCRPVWSESGFCV